MSGYIARTCERTNKRENDRFIPPSHTCMGLQVRTGPQPTTLYTAASTSSQPSASAGTHMALRRLCRFRAPFTLLQPRDARSKRQYERESHPIYTLSRHRPILQSRAQSIGACTVMQGCVRVATAQPPCRQPCRRVAVLW